MSQRQTSMFDEPPCAMCGGSGERFGHPCPACQSTPSSKAESFARHSDPHTSHTNAEKTKPKRVTNEVRVLQYLDLGHPYVIADDLEDHYGGQRNVWSRVLTTCWKKGLVMRKDITGHRIWPGAPHPPEMTMTSRRGSEVVMHFPVPREGELPR